MTFRSFFTLDSGYYDQKLYETCEKLGVGYVSGGKLDKGMKTYLAEFGASDYRSYQKETQTWNYVEFGGKAKSLAEIPKGRFFAVRGMKIVKNYLSSLVRIL